MFYLKNVYHYQIAVKCFNGHSLKVDDKTPNVRGTIFELEACIEKANEEIKLNGLEKRCVTVTGNFFNFVPEDGDCYILQNILHDWNDSKAMKILVNTRKAMKSDSKMIIIEEMIPDNDEHHVNTQFDVLMLAYFGGQTRSKRQIEEMCLQAKLKLHKYLKMKESAVYLMEFTPIN
ncbi:methyltransferase-like protein [Leptotrombidium deliense]|uniref:Acetylserotonin O-methyltransferase n=1 Tax=Leptotrombidium deliense TaxID=299467 RepID=A0A443RYN0_9ACAR|nr:methyltransferase-like protein [Leptotrombidium deliense]